MAPQTSKVIPIRSGHSQTQEVVALAFAYWREGFGLRDSSPKEALLRAHREVTHDRRGTPSLWIVSRQH